MAYPPSKYELNPDFYDLQPQEAAFFKQLTGIHDDELLKQHIIQVQTKAYEVTLTIFTCRYTSSFYSTSCRFIAISVSIVSPSFTARFLPCQVISKHSASSRNATGLSWSISVVVVSFTAFSQHFFFLLSTISRHWGEKGCLRRLAYPRHHCFWYSERYTDIHQILSISRCAIKSYIFVM